MGSSTQKTSQTRNPYAPAIPGLQDSANNIANQFQTDQANPLVPAAQQYTQGMIAGDHLNPSTNPHLGALTSAITDPIQARLSAQFGAAGRGSSGDAARYVSQGMSSGLAAPLFAQYQQGLAQQQQAAMNAPAMATAGGLATDNALQRYLALGNAGGTSTGTSTTSPSALQTIAGLGMTAAGMSMGMPGLSSMFGVGGMFGSPGAVGKTGI
jgi:hypothetical protein